MLPQVINQLIKLYGAMDDALDMFVAEMKALGVWESVTLQTLSEFARTMTSNGRGTDHAWGGNHFTMGGDVRGGVIHGQFPELRADGPNSISSTGQMLPTSPWEAIWRPIAEWFGVEEAQMSTVLPNLPAFSDGHLIATEQMFGRAGGGGEGARERRM